MEVCLSNRPHTQLTSLPTREPTLFLAPSGHGDRPYARIPVLRHLHDSHVTKMPALTTPSATLTLLPLSDRNQHHSIANDPLILTFAKLGAMMLHPYQNLASSTGDPREHSQAPYSPLRCPTKHPQPDRLWDHQDPCHTTLTRGLLNLYRSHPAPPPERPPAPPSDPGYLGGLPLPPRWNPGPPPGSAGPPGGAGPSGGAGPLSREPPGGWGPTMGAFPPPQGGNHYYYYYNAGPPPRNPRPLDDNRDALA
ncbi:hypothetical protein C0992_001233 [Termitomyces sp. T32_za158]|nr:hypothetical protein C0992_001233 [Termitomyces sp. T32_za158]